MWTYRFHGVCVFVRVCVSKMYAWYGYRYITVYIQYYQGGIFSCNSSALYFNEIYKYYVMFVY